MTTKLNIQSLAATANKNLKTKTKRAFALLMLALLAPAAAWAQSFSGGSGTETAPYLIATTDDMDALASQVNGGNSFSGTYFKMTADLDYTGKGYSIIGNYDNRFCGSFNGDGHTISNVTLSGDGEAKGIFGAIGSGGMVKNLALDQSSISGKSEIGGIAGFIENATISNCINHGSITSPSYPICAGLGGIVGYATNSSIIDCQNQGEVSRHDNAGCYATGGIVGRAENNCNISGCQNSAFIFGTENTGGIAGQANSGTIISHCKNTGTIEGQSRSGGIVGYADGANVSHCYNLARVTAYSGPAGGIVGRAGASSASNCLSLGIAQGYSNYNYASGGIVGWNYGDGNSYTNNYYRRNSYGISDYSTTMPVDVPGQAMYGYRITGVSPVVVSLPESATVGVAYEGNVYAGYEQSVVMNLDIPNPSITQQCYTLSAGALEDNGDGTYTITMPEEDITVSGNVVKYESFYYQLDCGGNNTAMVVQHDSYATMEWAVVPYSITHGESTYYVTGIGAKAFEGCTALERVSLHDEITTIGSEAFKNCSSIVQISTQAAMPPVAGQDAFLGVPENASIVGMPFCYQYDYSVAPEWNRFSNFSGSGPCDYNFTGMVSTSWSDPQNWMGGEVPDGNSRVAVRGTCEIYDDVTVGSITLDCYINEEEGLYDRLIVKSGKTLTANNFIWTTGDATHFIIEDGAQVVHPNAGAQATLEKNITAYTPNTKNGYHLIGHSFADNGAVSEMDNLLANDYDLYYYDEPTHYWMNQKQTANNFTELEAAKGYLYANSVSQTIGLKGTLNAANAMVNIPLSYEADALKGFNLVGNPFAHNVTTFTGTNVATEVYRMNGTKDNLMVSTISATDPLKPGEGFFVKAIGENASITFNAQTRGEVKATEFVEVPTITLNLTQDGLLVDRFILKRDGEPLEKFTLNENATRIYATHGGKDYAVATVGRDAPWHVSTTDE
ncbi:MAG: leucine-rich repeat protein, partial [Bacteroidales bacterium]|nr:leucine-rich repeat protein [Bacteroidales bacterium]